MIEFKDRSFGHYCLGPSLPLLGSLGTVVKVRFKLKVLFLNPELTGMQVYLFLLSSLDPFFIGKMMDLL